jgi:predicted alpha/beta superfamily hydrolase
MAEETTSLSAGAGSLDALMPGVSIRDVCSRSGLSYRIFIWRPADTSGPLPAIYLLDGNGTFPIAAATQAMQSRRAKRTGVGPAIIVGIGYPTRDWIDTSRRTFDYTPPVQSSLLVPRPGNQAWSEVGGADTFLGFLADELMPQLAREFTIDRERTALFGHSFGGLFALHALLARPTLIRSYIAASPSIWFAADELRARLQNLDVAAAAGCRLLITVGDLEQEDTGTDGRDSDDYGSWIRRNRMVDNARELAAEIASIAGGAIDVTFTRFEDENHASVVPAAISRALRFAFARD